MGNMERYNPNASENAQCEGCVFCLIASGQDKEAEVVKKNEELVCFRDIYPAAPHHYLVVPRQHIYSCVSLHRGHISLVERMAEMGKAVLRDQGITDMKDIRLGFHQPPYISVDHLHLHVLAPINQISKYMAYKFIPDTFRFITEQYLRKQLKDVPPSKHFYEYCMCSSRTLKEDLPQKKKKPGMNLMMKNHPH